MSWGKKKKKNLYLVNLKTACHFWTNISQKLLFFKWIDVASIQWLVAGTCLQGEQSCWSESVADKQSLSCQVTVSLGLPASDKCFKYRKRITGSHTYEVVKDEGEIKVYLITCLVLSFYPGKLWTPQP